MKTGMYRFSSRTLGLAAGLLGLLTNAAATSDISSPAKRGEELSHAKQMLATREAPAVGSDPFHSQAFAEATGAVVRTDPNPAGTHTVSARTAQELLQAIAANLKPSGYFVIGGQHTLVFGQKRVKAGGALTITFEGAEYTVEITAIDATNFTLRLNREEFTRTIK